MRSSECVSLRLIIVECLIQQQHKNDCNFKFKLILDTYLLFALNPFCLFEFKTPSSRNGEYKLISESDECLWHCEM